MTVTGPDAGTRAAVGPDPDDVIGTYRTWALIVGIGGVVVGLALLVGSSVGGARRTDGQPDGSATLPAPGFEPPVPIGVPAVVRTGGFAPPELQPRGQDEAPRAPAAPTTDPWAPPSTDEWRG